MPQAEPPYATVHLARPKLAVVPGASSSKPSLSAAAKSSWSAARSPTSPYLGRNALAYGSHHLSGADTEEFSDYIRRRYESKSEATISAFVAGKRLTAHSMLELDGIEEFASITDNNPSLSQQMHAIAQDLRGVMHSPVRGSRPSVTDIFPDISSALESNATSPTVPGLDHDSETEVESEDALSTEADDEIGSFVFDDEADTAALAGASSEREDKDRDPLVAKGSAVDQDGTPPEGAASVTHVASSGGEQPENRAFLTPDARHADAQTFDDHVPETSPAETAQNVSAAEGKVDNVIPGASDAPRDTAASVTTTQSFQEGVDEPAGQPSEEHDTITVTVVDNSENVLDVPATSQDPVITQDPEPIPPTGSPTEVSESSHIAPTIRGSTADSEPASDTSAPTQHFEEVADAFTPADYVQSPNSSTPPSTAQDTTDLTGSSTPTQRGSAGRATIPATVEETETDTIEEIALQASGDQVTDVVAEEHNAKVNGDPDAASILSQQVAVAAENSSSQSRQTELASKEARAAGDAKPSSQEDSDLQAETSAQAGGLINSSDIPKIDQQIGESGEAQNHGATHAPHIEIHLSLNDTQSNYCRDAHDQDVPMQNVTAPAQARNQDEVVESPAHQDSNDEQSISEPEGNQDLQRDLNDNIVSPTHENDSEVHHNPPTADAHHPKENQDTNDGLTQPRTIHETYPSPALVENIQAVDDHLTSCRQTVGGREDNVQLSTSQDRDDSQSEDSQPSNNNQNSQHRDNELCRNVVGDANRVDYERGNVGDARLDKMAEEDSMVVESSHQTKLAVAEGDSAFSSHVEGDVQGHSVSTMQHFDGEDDNAERLDESFVTVQSPQDEAEPEPDAAYHAVKKLHPDVDNEENASAEVRSDSFQKSGDGANGQHCQQLDNVREHGQLSGPSGELVDEVQRGLQRDKDGEDGEDIQAPKQPNSSADGAQHGRPTECIASDDNTGKPAGGVYDAEASPADSSAATNPAEDHSNAEHDTTRTPSSIRESGVRQNGTSSCHTVENQHSDIERFVVTSSSYPFTDTGVDAPLHQIITHRNTLSAPRFVALFSTPLPDMLPEEFEVYQDEKNKQHEGRIVAYSASSTIHADIKRKTGLFVRYEEINDLGAQEDIEWGEVEVHDADDFQVVSIRQTGGRHFPYLSNISPFDNFTLDTYDDEEHLLGATEAREEDTAFEDLPELDIDDVKGGRGRGTGRR